MIDLGKIDEIVNRLSESLPPGVTKLKDDVEAQFRTVLKGAFEKMDLVGRAEFDIQKAVLERTQIKLDALQRQLDEMENG